MIRISTKGRYGARFMLELAINYGKKPMLLKDIAKSQEISEGYLQHIVDALKGGGLIFSSRVGHGGYTLARPPEEITLRDILSILEGSINLVECIDNATICHRSDDCISRIVWTEIGNKLSTALQEVTLKKMVDLYNKQKESIPA